MKDYERDSVLLIGFAIVGVIITALAIVYFGLIIIESWIK